MNAPIVVQVFRFGFLALLWLFIFATLRVVRADLAGAGQPRAAVPTTRSAAQRPKPKRRGKALTHLLVTDGGLAGTRITLGEQPILIGRANDSTLVLTDDYASTRHARLVSRDGDWYVEDLGSTNGTYLDRTKVTGPTLIPPGVPSGSARRFWSCGHDSSFRSRGRPMTGPARRRRSLPVQWCPPSRRRLMSMALRYAVRSDRGLIRTNNEDSVYAGPRLLALADGMGGHAAGEVASKVVIAALEHLDEDRPIDDLLSTLRDATADANDHLRDWSCRIPTSRAWAPR